MTCK